MISSINFSLFWSQLFWVILGTLIVVFFWFFDLRGIIKNRELLVFFYFFSLALLVAALFSSPIRGIKGWIHFGLFNFQPAELVKISLLLLFAYFFAKRYTGLAHLKNILIPFFIFFLPALLILKQPDLGSTIVLFGMWLGFLLISGLRFKHLLVGSFILIAGFILAWSYFLAPYQKERIAGVFYPERDPLGINYNVIQSKIAIGSGGFFGKGFGQGTQIQLGFLPEAQTDFILAGAIEEWGLLGGLLLILSFAFLIYEIIGISVYFASDNFDRFVCLGAVIIFSIHFILNAGSALGLTPVIGLPFPFVSYGGSNLLTSFIMVAIINSIALRS